MKNRIVQAMLVCGILVLAVVWVRAAEHGSFIPAESPDAPGRRVSLTLDEAIAKARINNPDIKAKRARTDIIYAEIQKSSEFLRPTIFQEGTTIFNTTRFGLRVPLELGGRKKSKKDIARTKEEINAIQITTAILDLRNSIRQTYTQAYSGQEKVKSFQEIRDITGSLLEIAKKREKADDLDVILAEGLLLNITNDLESARYDSSIARNLLGRLIGEHLTEEIDLHPPNQMSKAVLLALGQDSGRLTREVPEALIEIAIRNRPELKEAEKRIELERCERSFIRSTRFPIITPYGGTDARNENSGWSVRPFFGVDIALPDYRAIKLSMKESEARINQLVLEQKVTEENIALEVTNAYLNLVKTREQIVRYETGILPRLQEVVRKSMQSFAEQNYSIIIPINIEQAYITNKLGYLRSLREYQDTISELERALGVGL